jgi:hypothetical protein
MRQAREEEKLKKDKNRKKEIEFQKLKLLEMKE